jgi:hypothetical protein
VVKEVWVTDKIGKDLESLAKDKGIRIEGLACILLRLALSDECFTERALKLIEKCDLNYGAVELEKKGW